MIYKHTERVDSIIKDKVKTKIKMKVKGMILISPCCCMFENAATRLKDAVTRLSDKPQCPNQSRQKTRNEFSVLTFLYSSL